MYLSDLQNKDIVSVKDGKKLGHIIDAEIKKINRDMVDFLIFFMKTGGWKKWYVSKSSIVFAMGKWYNATN